jgi:chemotaxis receptor (MCP) glutamine deamidase CheD
MAACASYN